MKETNKWSVRDVITTVLLSAVLIVIQLVVNMVCMANDFVSMVLSVGITMFLCAPVYMLMVSRIGKRFVTLIYMTILGVIFLLMESRSFSTCSDRYSTNLFSVSFIGIARIRWQCSSISGF